MLTQTLIGLCLIVGGGVLVVRAMRYRVVEDTDPPDTVAAGGGFGCILGIVGIALLLLVIVRTIFIHAIL